jgi:PAS domain S-box-containing protein
METENSTYVLLLSLIFILQAVALFLQYLVNRTYPGPGWWVLGAVALAVGFIANSARTLPVFGHAAVVANNALFTGGFALLYIGIMRFFGRRERTTLVIAYWLAVTLFAAYFTYVQDDQALRRVNHSLSLAVFGLLIGWRILQCKTRSTQISASFLAGVFLIFGLFFLLRALSVIFVDPEAGGAIASFIATGTYVVSLYFSMLWTLGLIVMVNQRLSEESREARDNLALIFDTIPDPIQIIGQPDDRIVTVNEAFLTLTGHARSDVIGKPSREVKIWTNPQDRKDVIDTVMQTGSCENLEIVFQRRDGAHITGILSARLISINGAPHIVGAVRDISERKRAEAFLRNSEERFRLVVQNSPGIITIWSRTGAVQYISPAAAQLPGLAPAAVPDQPAPAQGAPIQQQAADLPPEQLALVGVGPEAADNRAKIAAAVADCLEHLDMMQRFEYRLLTVTGEARDMEIVFQGFVHSDSGAEVVAVASDITAHRALARMLQASNSELEQRVAARTAELGGALKDLQRAAQLKDEFMAAVSHELRTPLIGVLGMADALEMQNRGPLNEHQLRAVQHIQSGGQRLLALVNSILRYTNLMGSAVTLQHEPCVLADLYARSVQSARRLAAQKEQTLTVSVTPPTLAIASDADAIEQMLGQLLDNAVKFTPPGGAIGLEAFVTNDGEAVRLTVWDTGIGIAPEQQQQIFEPFVQGDSSLARQYLGVGLGLALVRRTVELLDGAITLESEPGQGSRFTVTLPQR